MAESVPSATRGAVPTQLPIRLLISGLTILFFAARLYWKWNLNAIDLGLITIAALPWLSSIIERAKIGDLDITFREIRREQSQQRATLESILDFLVQNFVSQWELLQLTKLESAEPFPFEWSSSFEVELRRLLGLGLIERNPGKGITGMRLGGSDAHEFLRVTDRGRQYLSYRKGVADLNSQKLI
jgi:hypothetical protein